MNRHRAVLLALTLAASTLLLQVYPHSASAMPLVFTGQRASTDSRAMTGPAVAPKRALLAPPDLVAASAGEVRIRIRRGSADARHDLELRVDRASTGPGWDETHDLGSLSGTVTDIETDVNIAKADMLDITVHVDFQGFNESISYSDGRVPRPGETLPRIVEPNVNPNGRRLCGTGSSAVDITALYDTATNLISLSCWEDYTDWDYNDFSMAVDFVPADTPSGCVCRVTQRKVPQPVIQRALGEPGRVAAWNTLLNPGVPGAPPFPTPGYGRPPNPRRTCLDLQNRGTAWHPLWNNVIWRVGCTP